MADTNEANGHMDAVKNDLAPSENNAESRPATSLAPQRSTPAHEPRDPRADDLSATTGSQGLPLKSQIELGANHEIDENPTHSIDFTNHPSEAGPSRPKPSGSSHSSLQQDAGFAAGGPDETRANAIAYRRDPEVVIAYLVPMPKPAARGAPPEAPTRYFLYAPPPPHLVRPARGGEGYVRRLHRRWQQGVRASRDHAHRGGGGGGRFSPRGVRGRAVRGCARGLDALKHDDVTFLSRIHPATVRHLILIHPWALSGEQTPEEVLGAFRKQVLESKKKAKRDSFLSAALFLPALVIDTAAIFFGGLAEVDGIWMLVSVKAYRTARVISRKIDPEPKTLEVERKQLVEDAKKSGFPPPEPEPETDGGEPGAIRRSVDALRRSMGSVKHRIKYLDSTRRSQSRKRKSGGEFSSEDEGGSQANEASRSDLQAGFVGGGLGNHVEEDESERPALGESQTGPPELAGLSGFLEHHEEEEVVGDNQPVPGSARPSQGPGSGAILVDGSDGHRASNDSNASRQLGKKDGSNFQLTFYPSPAMDILTRYLQEKCHAYNSQAFQSPEPAATEQDVLAMIGWHPERRQHGNAKEVADDEQRQIRDTLDDLKLLAAKAAKAWDKTCRKQAKKAKRPLREKHGRKRVFLGRAKARRPQGVSRGRPKVAPGASDSEADIMPTTEKENRAVPSRTWIAALRERVRRRKQTAGDSQEGPKGSRAGPAAVLCIPHCLALGGRGRIDETNAGEDQARKTGKPGASGRTGGAMKRGLSMMTRGDARRQRVEARTATRRGPQHGDATAAGAEGPTTGLAGFNSHGAEGDTAGGGAGVAFADVIEHNTVQPKKSKRGRLFAIPAGATATIGAAIERRRRGRATTSTTTTGESVLTGAEAGKTSRSSAWKSHLWLLRTNVAKKRPRCGSERASKDVEKVSKEVPKEELGNKKKRGPVVGPVAGCLALPVTKARAIRDRRRKSKPNFDMIDPTAATGPLAAQVDGAGPPARPSINFVPHDCSGNQRRVSEEEEPELEATRRFGTAQYLPGHGQSEIPVSPCSLPGRGEDGP